MLPKTGCSNTGYKDWIFELRANNWSAHWPCGTLFSLQHNITPRCGDLVLVLVNDYLMMAHWLPGADGISWLVEPGRIIEVARRSVIAILGVLTPLLPIVAGDL